MCIIQDDPQDWQCESANMAMIYRSGTITISVSGATDSDGGCDLEETVTHITHFCGPIPASSDLATISSSKESGPRSSFGAMNSAPIHARAWVLQEKLLSRRILHTFSNQFMWQCATLAESEDKIYSEVRSNKPTMGYPCKVLKLLDSYVKINHSSKSCYDEVLRLERVWWLWVEDYMHRTLKHGSDRYAAFAGIVLLYQEMSGDEPIVGLWKRNLVLQLAWQAEGPEDDQSKSNKGFACPGTRRPSWTWMTYPNKTAYIWHVYYQFPWSKSFRPADATLYQAEVIDIKIDWDGIPLTSTPTGTLTLRSVISTLPRDEHMGLDIDVRHARRNTHEFQCLVLYAVVRDLSYIYTVYLIIEPTHGSSHEYSRLGLRQEWRRLEPSEDQFFLSKQPHTTILLV